MRNGAVLTNLVSNPYQFTGYEYDSGSGYNYAVARYEAGRWGRFQSPDAYLGSASITNPQSLNRYSYVLNNPTNLVDMLGLDCTFTTDANGTMSGSCVVNEPASGSGDGSLDPTGGGDGGASKRHAPLQDGSDPGSHGGGGRDTGRSPFYNNPTCPKCFTVPLITCKGLDSAGDVVGGIGAAGTIGSGVSIIATWGTDSPIALAVGTASGVLWAGGNLMNILAKHGIGCTGSL